MKKHNNLFGELSPLLLLQLFVFSLFISACDNSAKPNQANTAQNEAKTETPNNPYLAKGFASEQEALAYAIGFDNGRGIINRYQYLEDIGIKMDVEATKKGLLDAFNQLSQQEEKLSEAQMKALIYGLDKTVKVVEQQLAQQEAEQQITLGNNYLEENATREGIQVLASGLQYKIIKTGTGASPTFEDKVVYQAIGKLINGKEVENTYNFQGNIKPVPITRMIAGLSEALQLMKIGSKWEITIPPKLAYGSSKHGDIPANAVLMYTVELTAIVQ